MTIKIRTWRTTIGAEELGDRNVVCVLPRDWFRVMAVVGAAEQDEVARSFRQYDATPLALDALRKHLSKRK